MLSSSLRASLAAFWLSTTIVSVALGTIWWTLVQHGTEMQTAQARTTLVQACEAIQKGYGQMADTSAHLETEAIVMLLDQALGSYQGVEGGLWSPLAGFIAYAYPTYEGHGIKRDVPAAEMASITNLASAGFNEHTAMTDVRKGRSQSIVSRVCPLPAVGGDSRMAWVMVRVNAAVGAVYDYMAVGLVTLLGFVVLSGLWLGCLLARWSKHLRIIETSLRSGSLEALPRLPLSGDQELDSISRSVNAFSERLQRALTASDRLTKKLVQKNRLATLGRMAAVVAHEIRNPLATIRIKAENALAAPERRIPAALTAILAQSQRLEAVVTSILQMFRSFEIQAEPTEMAAWLEDRRQAVAAPFAARGVTLSITTTVDRWSFDRVKLGQAIDNLVVNAVQHSSPGQTVELAVHEESGVLCLSVRDHGPGISAAIADQLFEPFVTGRPDGIGLGLMVVKETVEAHHGRVFTSAVSDGACFTIEVPWPAS